MVITTPVSTWVPLLILLSLTSCSGCAIDYFDARNGIEHVWGIGHIAMKVGPPNEGLKAVGRRTDSLGFSMGKGEVGYQLGLGWNSYQQIDVMDQNTQLCLAWPTGSLYNARVGSDAPPNMTECGLAEKEKNP
jgi:hypothetical protein